MTTREFAAKHKIKLRPAGKLTPLGQEIVNYCLDHDVRRSEFADKAGIARVTLNSLMTGKRKYWDERVIAGVMAVLEPATE